MSNAHHIIRPADIFTDSGWRQVEQHIDRLPEVGGCLCLVFDIAPMTRNFIAGSITVHSAQERAAIRKAVERARAKQQKSDVGIPASKETT